MGEPGNDRSTITNRVKVFEGDLNTAIVDSGFRPNNVWLDGRPFAEVIEEAFGLSSLGNEHLGRVRVRIELLDWIGVSTNE